MKPKFPVSCKGCKYIGSRDIMKEGKMYHHDFFAHEGISSEGTVLVVRYSEERLEGFVSTIETFLIERDRPDQGWEETALDLYYWSKYAKGGVK